MERILFYNILKLFFILCTMDVSWMRPREQPMLILHWNFHMHLLHVFKKSASRDWRDGSGVQRTDCSSKGPGFNAQQLHDSSHLSVKPVSEDPNTHGQNTNAHKNKIK